MLIMKTTFLHGKQTPLTGLVDFSCINDLTYLLKTYKPKYRVQIKNSSILRAGRKSFMWKRERNLLKYKTELISSNFK